MENKSLSLRQTNLPALLQPNTVIKEQKNKPALEAHICSLLLRIAKKYQIPNFDEESALLLAEDTLERYKYEPIETLVKCLELPPHTGEKNWRLTPDTISEWMAITLEKEAEKKEIEFSKQKNKSVSFELPNDNELSEETKKMIQDYINSLSGFKQVQALTDADIKKYGKSKPVKTSVSAGHSYSNKEYLIERELKRRYLYEKWMHDERQKVENDGRIIDEFLSFEEWKML